MFMTFFSFFERQWPGISHPSWIWKVFFFVNFFTMKYTIWTIAFQSTLCSKKWKIVQKQKCVQVVVWLPQRLSKYYNTIWHFFLHFIFSIMLLQSKFLQIAFFWIKEHTVELVALRSSSNVNTKFFGIQAWKNSHCNHHQMDEIIGLFAFEREIPLQTQQRKIK